MSLATYTNCSWQVQVKLSLYTSWRHTWEWKYISTRTNLGTRRRLAVKFTPLPLCPWRNSPWHQLKMRPGEHETSGRETINVDLSCMDGKLGLCYTKRGTRTQSVREQGAEDNTLTEERGITWGWRKLGSEELHALRSSPMITIMYSWQRIIRWRHVAGMTEKQTAFSRWLERLRGKDCLEYLGKYGRIMNWC